MAKKLIIGMLGLAVVVAGITAFSAFTAQWVNITAHVEKEIEIACVVAERDSEGKIIGWVVDEDGCGFGIVYPQEAFEKNVEVTLSNSFMSAPTRVSSVQYQLMWECKLVDETALATAPDGSNPCREDLKLGDTGKLTGNIRDYITVDNPITTCTKATTVTPGGLAKLLGIFDASIDRDGTPKCFYHITFDVPVCAGHYNPNTDDADPKQVDCVEDVDDDDPQKWDRYADLGDMFKIQVTKHVLD